MSPLIHLDPCLLKLVKDLVLFVTKRSGSGCFSFVIPAQLADFSFCSCQCCEIHCYISLFLSYIHQEKKKKLMMVPNNLDNWTFPFVFPEYHI